MLKNDRNILAQETPVKVFTIEVDVQQYHAKSEDGMWEKKIIVIIRPHISLHKEKTKEIINELMNQTVDKVREILDFDNS